MPFHGDVWSAEYLIAGLVYVTRVVANRLGVEVTDWVSLTGHDDSLVGGILRVQHLLPALHALAVGRVLHLTDGHLHVQLSDATAGRYPHAGGPIALAGDVVGPP